MTKKHVVLLCSSLAKQTLSLKCIATLGCVPCKCITGFKLPHALCIFTQIQCSKSLISLYSTLFGNPLETYWKCKQDCMSLKRKETTHTLIHIFMLFHIKQLTEVIQLVFKLTRLCDHSVLQ